MRYLETVASLLNRNLSLIDKHVVIWEVIIYPIIFIFVASYAFSQLFEGRDLLVGNIMVPYPTYVTSGLVIYNSMVICGVAGSIIWNDRRNGMFDQIMGMPFTRFQYILSNLLTIIIMGFIGAVVILIVGIPTLIGYVNVTGIGVLYFVFGLVCCSIFFGSIFIMASTILANRQKFTVFINGVYTTGEVSSVLYPVSGVPSLIYYAFYLNPLTYMADLVRAGLFYQVSTFTNIEVTILSLVTVTALLVAVILIRRTNI